MTDVPVACQSIAIVILTFNSAATIERTISSVKPISKDIFVVDSFSGDDTVAICRRIGCHVVQRAFANYADQRNWAIDHLALAQSWQLHIDADEELSPELVARIQRLDLNSASFDGWIVGRKLVFMGRVLRFGAIAKTWHYRLFRTGHGRCEDRLYDQHFVAKGRVGRIDAFLLDHQDASLSEWTRRHNRWSDLETEELAQTSATPVSSQIDGRLLGNAIERKRFLKERYAKLPLFVRPFLYFTYRYVIRLGFLDGRPGLIYHVLQGFWFRFLIDAKVYEERMKGKWNNKGQYRPTSK